MNKSYNEEQGVLNLKLTYTLRRKGSISAIFRTPNRNRTPLKGSIIRTL